MMTVNLGFSQESSWYAIYIQLMTWKKVITTNMSDSMKVTSHIKKISYRLTCQGATRKSTTSRVSSNMGSL